MIRKLYPCIFSLALLTSSLCTSLYAEPKVVQFENQLVFKLDIQVANQDYKSEYHKKNVLSKIKTKENRPFSQVDFDKDLKTLTQDYIHIEPSLKMIDGKLLISVKVWPKPIIRNIELEGNQKVNSTNLRKELAIAQATVFDRQTFNKAFHKLKAYYVKNGFFEAQLDYDVRYVDESNEVDIVILINEGRAGRIKNIVFEGFSEDEESDVLNMMVTKEYSFFLSWLTEQGTYNEEAIQQDQFVILNYLQNQGYADTEVEIKVCETNEPNRITIVIAATKGHCYTFSDITISGNTLFKREEIAKQIRIKTGKPYSPERVRATIENITNLYGRNGYIEAFVTFEPKLNCDNKTYSVHFTIDEGIQYRVGLIKIIGNSLTQSKVILHETLLAPGEIFNKDKLILTERRLTNIGYFKNVNVYAVRSDQAVSCLGESYRDVHIEVEETTTGNFSAFAGFSTSESFFGGFNITEKNFNIAGLKYIFCKDGPPLRGGGEYAHFTATFGAKTNKYVLSWTKPYFNDTPWSVGFDIERSTNKYISSDYELISTGFNLHGVYDVNAFVNIGVHYRLRYAQADADSDEEDKSPQLKKQIDHDNGIISAAGWSIIYNSCDSIMRPSKGLKSKLELEAAGFGGDFRFLSIGYINTFYYPVDSRGVFKFRGDARFIQPIFGTVFSSLPLDERLFLGGGNEIRGYRPYRLGPKFENTDDPMGGISMQLFSAEYQLTLLPIVDAFAFFDAGFLGDQTWQFDGFFKSVGAGLRLQIMGNGPPLTIGMGFPLGAQDSTNVKRFFLDIGGRF